MWQSFPYSTLPDRHRKSIDEINTKIHRAAVNQEYCAISRNRDQKIERNSMSASSYIRHLEEANKKLHLQLDQEKSRHEKEISIMRDRMKAKDSLLEECEKEIMKIRKQYEIIDNAVGRGKNKSSVENRRNHVEAHGLLKQRKNRV